MFSELNGPARQHLCLRFAVIPHEITGKTRGQKGVASPFPKGSLIPVYPGALCPETPKLHGTFAGPGEYLLYKQECQ